MANKLSVREFNEKLERLATLPYEGMTVAAIRTELYALGITAIERDEKLVQVSKARKAELVDACEQLTRKQRALDFIAPDINITDEKQLDTLLAERVEVDGVNVAELSDRYYNHIKNYTLTRWDCLKSEWLAPNEKIHQIVTSFLTTILRRYPDEKDKSINRQVTRLDVRGKVKKNMLRMVEAESQTWMKEQLEANIKTLFSYIAQNEEVKAESEYKAVRDKKQVEVRSTNRIKVRSMDNLVKRAYQVLNNVNASTPKTEWKNIALALCVVTGRRAFSEILSSGTFEVESEYFAWFTGQAKTKGKSEDYFKNNPSYRIPTLVPAQLVVNGVKWLDEHDKRAVTKEGNSATAEEIAHARYGKELGAHLKSSEWCAKYARELLQKTPVKKESNYANPHRLRQLYAITTAKVLQPENIGKSDFIGLVMGHSRGVPDPTTTMRYDADFVMDNSTLGFYPNSPTFAQITDFQEKCIAELNFIQNFRE